MTDSEILAERITHEREMREASALALEKALTMQAEEYARRLHELNEAHKRAAADRADFLLRVEYGIQHKALEDRLRAVERMLWIALGAILLIELFARFVV
jgi:hypothetical protein